MSNLNHFSYIPNELVNKILNIVFLPQNIKITLTYKYPGPLNDFKLDLEWLNPRDSNQFPFKNKLQEKIEKMKRRTLGYPGAFGHVIKELQEEFKKNFKMMNVEQPRKVSKKTLVPSYSSNNNNSSSSNSGPSVWRIVATRTISQVFELNMLKNIRSSTSKQFRDSFRRLKKSKRQQNSKSKSKINSKNKSKSRN